MLSNQIIFGLEQAKGSYLLELELYLLTCLKHKFTVK
jgi:hypothetical protein